MAIKPRRARSSGMVPVDRVGVRQERSSKALEEAPESSRSVNCSRLTFVEGEIQYGNMLVSQSVSRIAICRSRDR